MLEITILSVSVGTLGLQIFWIGGWLHWQQGQAQRQQDQEEEALTPYEVTDENTAGSQKTVLNYIARDRDSTPKNGNSKRDPRLVGWVFKIVRAQVANKFRVF